ncbi:hypothetical protein [Burkholderia cenocepacia]|uniref:hypothetical protein n=1 Tax=Burkholderia cenocepacia TaxID=95486 RepID=UPI0038CC07C9
MSKEMREFLDAYLAWVEAGAPQGKPFERSYGLCSNIANHVASFSAFTQIDSELPELFAASGLEPNYPFGGFAVYWDDHHNGAHHRNPSRIAWVREQLNRTE